MENMRCFILSPSQWVRRVRRSICLNSHCRTADGGRHLADAEYDDVWWERTSALEWRDAEMDGWDLSRWPVRCKWCGYNFSRWDTKVIFPHRLFQIEGSEEYVMLDEAKAGAIFNDRRRLKGPDGNSYHLKLPTGKWFCLDDPLTNGRLNQRRTGIAPDLTIDAPIVSDDFYGWLKEGILFPENNLFQVKPK